MDNKGFRFADKEEQVKKINRFLVIGVFVFCFITAGIVCGSYLNGHRSLGYFGAIGGIMLVSNLVNAILYRRMPQCTKIRLVALVELMILSLMISAVYESDYMRFMPVIPFIGCILFYDVKFSLLGSVYLVAMNWIVIVVRCFVTKDFAAEDVADRLTGCLVITVMMFIVLYTTLVGKRFNEDSLNRLRSEAEKQKEEDEILSTWFVRDEYINAGWFKRVLLTIQFLFRDTHGKTGYQDPVAFARYYEVQKENYVGLQSEHEINGKVYHVTNYLDRSKEATAFDKIDELIDRNR